jgi:hypothetical protein
MGAFDYDQEKAMLVKKSYLLESSLDKDMDKLKGYIEEYGKNFLVITGSLLATYVLMRLLTKSSSDDEKAVKTIPIQSETYKGQPQQVVHMVKEESEVMKQIKMSIALFLISIAKQKLQEFMEKKLETK